MHLFAGSSHPALAKAIAKELGIELGAVTLKKFSCGERYVRYEESVRGKDVYIVQTSGLNPDDALVELFLMIQAAKLAFARSVHVILPNYPYARQDRVSQWREPISAKLIAHLLEESGADHIMTINLHSDQIQGFFSVPADALDTSHIFIEYLKDKHLPNPIIVSPDIGGAKIAKKFADKLGAELAILHKSRPSHNKAEILEVVGEVDGKTCIIFDDMIDTAGTLLTAQKALLSRGANKDIYVAATHPIFSGPAIERLEKATFKEIIVTDTMPIKKTAVKGLKILSVAPMIAEVIKNVDEGSSVTQMYGKK
ncbi:MAG: ribose-phosphate pyrophosphokinase [bacterium]|nr:ribose-phosphate pyrophosphokinase [bacterium]